MSNNGYTIDRQSDTLIITKPWRSVISWFAALFGLVWLSVVQFMVGDLPILIVLIFALSAIATIYVAVATFLNRTVISVGPSRIGVTRGPVPWPFQKDWEEDSHSALQVYSEKGNVKQNNKATYDLVCAFNNGAKHTILTAVSDRTMLKSIEVLIETKLGITDDVNFGLDLDQDGVPLELKELQTKLDAMDAISKWLPASARERLEEAKARAQRDIHTHRSSFEDAQAREPISQPAATPVQRPGLTPEDLADYSPIPEPTPEDRRPEPPGRTAKTLSEDEDSINYSLYAAEEGTDFLFADEPYRIQRRSQIDFVDPGTPTGVQLTLTPTNGIGGLRQLYAQMENDRWYYYEERRLDDHEVETLGFTYSATLYPRELDNGEDRYFPRNVQDGMRYDGLGRNNIRQFIYFTTSTSTQFRAVQPAGRSWEVYIQEVVDAGVFEPVNG